MVIYKKNILRKIMYDVKVISKLIIYTQNIALKYLNRNEQNIIKPSAQMHFLNLNINNLIMYQKLLYS